MSEITEKTEVANDQEKKSINPEKGTMILAVPIRSRSEDVSEIDYDFSKITTANYIAAMDSDREALNPFRISHKQAFNLFAYAVAAATEELDAKDILERMNSKDAIYAVQLGSLFFAQQTQAAATRAVKG